MLSEAWVVETNVMVYALGTAGMVLERVWGRGWEEGWKVRRRGREEEGKEEEGKGRRRGREEEGEGGGGRRKGRRRRGREVEGKGREGSRRRKGGGREGRMKGREEEGKGGGGKEMEGKEMEGREEGKGGVVGGGDTIRSLCCGRLLKILTCTDTTTDCRPVVNRTVSATVTNRLESAGVIAHDAEEVVPCVGTD